MTSWAYPSILDPPAKSSLPAAPLIHFRGVLDPSRQAVHLCLCLRCKAVGDGVIGEVLDDGPVVTCLLHSKGFLKARSPQHNVAGVGKVTR